MDKIKEAEARLFSLESPGLAVDAANSALRVAEFTGDPIKIQEAKNAYADAVAAEREANISPRDIAKAAQAVLDARGEAHTETNILPPNHGIITVKAERRLIDLTRDNAPAEEIAAAEEALEAARAADAEVKIGHAEEQHAATVAALKGDAA